MQSQAMDYRKCSYW